MVYEIRVKNEHGDRDARMIELAELCGGFGRPAGHYYVSAAEGVAVLGFFFRKESDVRSFVSSCKAEWPDVHGTGADGLSGGQN